MSTILLLGACGGGDDDQDSSAGPTPANQPTPTTDQQAKSQGGIVDSARVTQQCVNYASYAAQMGMAMAAAMDPSAAKQLEAWKDKADLADAPDEIKDDFQVMVDYATELGEVLAKHPANGSAYNAGAIAAMAEFSKTVDQQRLDEAGKNIQAWLDENCPG